MKPVKLFVILEDADVQHAERLLESNFGPIDQRNSLIPNGRKILSFDRLIDLETIPECSRRLAAIAAGSHAGFLQNHRVVVANKEVLQFKNGKIELPPDAVLEFTGQTALNFFSEIRGIYRKQLRTMCLLRSAQ